MNSHTALSNTFNVTRNMSPFSYIMVLMSKFLHVMLGGGEQGQLTPMQFLTDLTPLAPCMETQSTCQTKSHRTTARHNSTEPPAISLPNTKPAAVTLINQ